MVVLIPEEALLHNGRLSLHCLDSHILFIVISLKIHTLRQIQPQMLHQRNVNSLFMKLS